eukprot:7992536-Pyramimonas_sp.AAC.1
MGVPTFAPQGYVRAHLPPSAPLPPSLGDWPSPLSRAPPTRGNPRGTRATRHQALLEGTTTP